MHELSGHSVQLLVKCVIKVAVDHVRLVHVVWKVALVEFVGIHKDN